MIVIIITIIIIINLHPLIRTPPLWGTTIFDNQFIRRHDYPPHKKRFLVRSTPLIRNPP